MKLTTYFTHVLHDAEAGTEVRGMCRLPVDVSWPAQHRKSILTGPWAWWGRPNLPRGSICFSATRDADFYEVHLNLVGHLGPWITGAVRRDGTLPRHDRWELANLYLEHAEHVEGDFLGPLIAGSSPTSLSNLLSDLITRGDLDIERIKAAQRVQEGATPGVKAYYDRKRVSTGVRYDSSEDKTR